MQFFTASSAQLRLEQAARAVNAMSWDKTTLVIAASRAAADDLAIHAAATRGGLFGVTRLGFVELAMKLALPSLARMGLSPMGALGNEALVTRAVFEGMQEGDVHYYAPVARTPGFPRALSRTLGEVQLAGVAVDDLTAVDSVGPDLGLLLARVERDAASSGTVHRTSIFAEACRVLEARPHALGADLLVLLDVPLGSTAEAAFARALAATAKEAVVVCPDGDARTLTAWSFTDQPIPSTLVAQGRPGHSALSRLQQFLFASDLPPHGELDETVTLFSAPGEGREAVEIARRVLEEAARGVAFDDIAVLLRTPQSYLGLVENAFARAGIPAWFERGTRRPDPAGRALLALIACAEEHLSARRFAEYLSLGQVPITTTAEPGWISASDDVVDAVVPDADRAADPSPLDEAPPPDERDADRVVAGTLQAPWRWEELLVEAYVIEGLERWRRRLPGLRHEYERRRAELAEDEPDSPRLASLTRNIAQLQHLEDLALPVVETLAGWRDQQPWSVWLERLRSLVPRVLRQPTRVLRVLMELTPLGAVGPVRLSEVREVLAPRLRLLTHEPPRRRHGRVFVGSCQAARGRSFSVVFVPGVAERMFPQRVREDPLLVDARRAQLPPGLASRQTRADDERLQLRLAVGAARERLYASYPRVELRESRSRVPSFYVLDIMRAVTGSVPSYSEVAERANREGAATMAWPAPPRPERAIDDLEHDLSVLGPLLVEHDASRVSGRARYLVELNPTLRRSVTERWARHQPRWAKADGLVHASPAAQHTLSAHRLAARSYSLTALQRYAACPYQFLLAAIYQLAPREEPAPLQRLDPLTRGSLFHEIQTEFYRTLQHNGQLPVTDERLAAARRQLEWVIAKVTREAADLLAPAIDRVWSDEVSSIRRDLLLWLDRLPLDTEWVPERFEFAFGLPHDASRDPSSVATPAVLADKYKLRGAIDLVERNPRTGALRVTDHKTGKNRVNRATIVHGGQVLQPVLYGMAVEALTGHTVYEGRLWYCTTAGEFEEHAIPLNERARESGLEVLEIIDRAVERGPLAARPARDACKWCDFTTVCGQDEAARTSRKPPTEFADLDALRRMP